MNWKNKEEEKRGYTDDTHELILRMERANLRVPQTVDRKRVEKAVSDTYKISGIKVPKFDWKVDITDKDFRNAAGAAGAARAARAAWAAWAAWAARAAGAAGAAGAARAARAAGAAWAAGAARAARAAGAAWEAGAAGAAGAAREAGVDFDFDFLLDEAEFLQHEQGIENDKKALAIYMKFLEARENGLGYFSDSGTKGICYLVPAPTVRINSLNRFHSDVFSAISWEGGLQCYFLHGVSFPEDLWKEVVSGTMPFEKILAIKDIDQRTQAMKYGNPQKFLEHSHAEKIDERIKFSPEGKKILYQLYKIPKGDIFLKDAYYVLYDCPSTDKKYMSGVMPCKTVASAMAWKFQIFEEEWSSLTPIVHET